MRIFFVVFLSLLSLVWFYVGSSLIAPMVEGSSFQVGAWILFGVSYLFQLWRVVFFRVADRFPRMLFGTYVFLGTVIHLFVVSVVKDLLSFVVEVPLEFYPYFFAGSLALSLLAVVMAFKGPRVRTDSIQVSQSGESLKIVQISDLHVGPLIGKKYVQRVVDQILSLNPDIVVATGDIGDASVSEAAESVHLLSQVSVRFPCFYVPGNHEYYWGGDLWVEKMTQIGFRVLLSRGERVEIPGKIKLWMGGVPDPQGQSFISSHVHRADHAMSGGRDLDGHFKILLAHQPKSYLHAEEAGFDLMMCGHTHGGQFFPFNFLVGFFNPFSRGMNRYKNLWIYVNLGTGFWGPPMRLGAVAEITELYLQSSDRGA